VGATRALSPICDPPRGEPFLAAKVLRHHLRADPLEGYHYHPRRRLIAYSLRRPSRAAGVLSLPDAELPGPAVVPLPELATRPTSPIRTEASEPPQRTAD
jgi:hypothetical protein